ncbi:MAG TPA: hypothetical protein ENI99_05770 [Sedimenticola sp.]|nr:hypothetical protein [Sedimenticola sp.]
MRRYIVPLVLGVLLSGFMASAFAQSLGFEPKGGLTDICRNFLGKGCDAEQESLLRVYVGNIDIQGLSKKLEAYSGAPPAFDVLPKDHSGFVNWNKAVTDGLIRPRGSLTGEEDEYEGYLANMMVFRTKIAQIPDVIFPHGMHTYWLNCDSCHPEPFKKKRGSSNFTMGNIIEGKYCGKCHGKVSFPPETFKNCNRCHILKKTRMRVWKEVPE